MANKYIAFISYRHAELDSAIAKSLHSLIEQYRIPRGIRKAKDARLGVVFRDQEELHAASDLSSEIQNALNSTEYLIVICSKNSVESPWVTREVDHFLQNHDRSQVLTVLASGEPMEVFPPQLTHTPEGELIEPLAVDIRADTIAASRKKLRKELPRLIAAMLRCPYDALVMREQKRKTRRITAIAAGAMSILLGFTSMVLLKNQQIALANNQLEEKNTQLNQANVVLEEQKAAIQLRESQLLVQSALEDLDNADYYSAMQKAVDALPMDETDTRPYYAPAEQVLMEAMGVFRVTEPESQLNTIRFPHMANVNEFLISQDGTRLVSIDNVGTTNCFDVDTQQQLWYQYAKPTDASSGLKNLHLFLSADNSTLIRSTQNQLSAYDLETGSLIWEENSLNFATDYMFHNPQRDTLVTVASSFTEDFNYQYHLVEIQATTGQILQQLLLEISDSFLTYTFASPTATRTPAGGIFDGDQFIGTFLDNENYLHCYRADLSQGTVEIFYTHPEPSAYLSEVCALQLLDSNRLVLALYSSASEQEITLMQLDIQTGELLWEAMPESPNIPFASYSVSPHMIYVNSRLILGYCDRLILLDPETGAVLSQHPLNGLLTNLTPLSAYNFAFSTDIGTYAMGWIQSGNALKLTTDASILTHADLDPHNTLQVWGGGIVQLQTDADSLVLGVGNHVAPGFVALIPSQEKNTIQIVRISESLSLIDYKEVSLFQNKMKAASDCIAFQAGNHLVAGPFYDPANYSTYVYVVLDLETGKIVETLSPEGYYDPNELFWLPDTQSLLTNKRTAGITLHHADGTTTSLYHPDTEQDAFTEADGCWSSYALFRNTAVYLSDQKTLLSVATNPRQLRIWRDGASETQVDLPASLTIAPEDSKNYSRIVKAGSNGWILTSLHLAEEPIPLKNVAVYDTNQQKWTTPDSTDTIPAANAVAFANSAATMAYVDPQGNIRLLDLNTGKLTSHFGAQLSAESILYMTFFRNDSCLAVKTVGGYLHLYDLSTGQLLCYTQFADSYGEYLQVFEDNRNQRLYIYGGNRSGICLDMGSWSVLGDVENLLFFHGDSNLLYQKDRILETSPVSRAQIPGTMELVAQAKKALADTHS